MVLSVVQHRDNRVSGDDGWGRALQAPSWHRYAGVVNGRNLLLDQTHQISQGDRHGAQLRVADRAHHLNKRAQQWPVGSHPPRPSGPQRYNRPRVKGPTTTPTGERAKNHSALTTGRPGSGRVETKTGTLAARSRSKREKVTTTSTRRC